MALEVISRAEPEAMTESEMCALYREAKNKNTQIRILQELTGLGQLEVMKTLLKHGEKLPRQTYNKLFHRLDQLEAQISEREKEYKAIVEVIKMG